MLLLSNGLPYHVMDVHCQITRRLLLAHHDMLECNAKLVKGLLTSELLTKRECEFKSSASTVSELKQLPDFLQKITAVYFEIKGILKFTTEIRISIELNRWLLSR